MYFDRVQDLRLIASPVAVFYRLTVQISISLYLAAFRALFLPSTEPEARGCPHGNSAEGHRGIRQEGERSLVEYWIVAPGLHRSCFGAATSTLRLGPPKAIFVRGHCSYHCIMAPLQYRWVSYYNNRSLRTATELNWRTTRHIFVVF